MKPAMFPCFAQLLMCLCLSAPALAQSEKSITVTGQGQHVTPADQLEIVGVLTEKAESAEDVTIAFRDTRRRAVKSLEEIGIEGLSVVGNGAQMALVNPSDGGMGGMIVMGGGGGGAAPAIDPEYRVKEKITLTLPGFDQLDMDERLDVVAELLVACSEAGVDVSENAAGGGMGFAMVIGVTASGGGDAAQGAVRLTCADPAAAQAEARARAMADAREQAAQLAELAGVTLGGVARIGSSERVSVLGLGDDSGVTRDAEGRLVYSTSLTVTFEIE